MRSFSSVIFGFVLLGSIVTASVQPHPQRGKGKVTRESGLTSVPLDGANRANVIDSIAPGDKGTLVLRAQILLDRASFSPGEIDAFYGPNLRSAIRGFQNARKLPVDDRV